MYWNAVKHSGLCNIKKLHFALTVDLCASYILRKSNINLFVFKEVVVVHLLSGKK